MNGNDNPLFKIMIPLLVLILGGLTAIFPTMVGLYLGYLLIAGAIAVSIIFPVVKAFENPKAAAKTLAGIGALGLIFLIGYMVASDQPIMGFYQGQLVELASANVARLSTAGVYTALIILGLTIISFIGAEISGFFK